MFLDNGFKGADFFGFRVVFIAAAFHTGNIIDCLLHFSPDGFYVIADFPAVDVNVYTFVNCAFRCHNCNILWQW